MENSIQKILMLLDCQLSVCKSSVHTDIYSACASGDVTSVSRFVAIGIDINVKNDDTGMNAFHYACRYGHEKIVPLLIEAGINIDAKSNYGWNALHYASRYGHEKIIPLLIEAGIDIDAKSNNGRNALHYACIYGHDKIVPLLIEAGIHIDAKSNSGRNALHYACRYGHENIARLLIEGGIDIDVKIGDGKNALDLALAYDDTIACLLVNAGCALSEKDLERDCIAHILETNAKRRAAAKKAMLEVEFLERHTGSKLDCGFPQIRNSILAFAFRSPHQY